MTGGPSQPRRQPPADGPASTPRTSPGAIALMLALSVLGAIAVLEIYVRASGPLQDLRVLTGLETGPNPMGRWARLEPFAAYVPSPGNYADGKTVNAHGFISTPELPVEKANGTVRIAFLGGSSTAGTGVNLADQDTWPWKTIARLRDAGAGPVDFINAAVGGYSSFESFGRLWSRLRHFRPDIVVVYHGWNEMYYFDKVDRIHQWRLLGDGSWTFARTDSPVEVVAPHWIDPLIGWSQALVAIRLIVSPQSGEAGGVAGVLASDFDIRALQIWRDNLRLIKAATALAGAQLVVIKQATLIGKDAGPCFIVCRYDYHGFNHAAHLRAYQGIYSVIDAEIDAADVLDATALTGNGENFSDHVHLTPVGTTRLAKQVAEALAARLAARR